MTGKKLSVEDFYHQFHNHEQYEERPDAPYKEWWELPRASGGAVDMKGLRRALHQHRAITGQNRLP